MRTCRKVFSNKGTDRIALKKLFLFRVAIINIGFFNLIYFAHSKIIQLFAILARFKVQIHDSSFCDNNKV